MNWFKSLFRVWRRELYLCVTDFGVLLFFIALPLFYPPVYTLIYGPEVVKNIDAVVVDNSRTAESRELVRALDATQGINIIGYVPNLGDAKEAMHRKDCYAVFEIPRDYARTIGNGGQAVVTLYQDMSLMIRYRQILFSLTDVQMHEAQQFTARRIADRLGGFSTVISGLPVNTEGVSIGNPAQGFASFLMIGIFVLILHQAMLLGICMVAGTRRDRRRRLGLGYDPLEIHEADPVATVLGRSFAYLSIYLPMVVLVIAIVPRIFSLPQYGNFADIFCFISVMLLAVTFFGQVVQLMVRERESSMILVVFTSAIFLFVSGITWPRYAFNPFWKALSDLIPSTWGVEGFVNINSNGAGIHAVNQAYTSLWILCAVYFVLAVLINHFTRPRLSVADTRKA